MHVTRRDAHEPALHRATNGHDARARPGFRAACSQGMTGDQPGTTGRAGESSSDVAEKLEQLRPERIVELEGFARLHCALHQVLAIRSRPESPGDGRDASCAVRVDAQAATSKVAWIVHIT